MKKVLFCLLEKQNISYDFKWKVSVNDLDFTVEACIAFSQLVNDHSWLMLKFTVA